MTIIQIVLTIGLGLFFIYGSTHREMIRYFRLLFMIVPTVGIVMVWRPDLANAIAAAVGVGRGADLMLYCWVVLSMLVGFNMHLKLRIMRIEIVKLTREIALSSASQPVKESSLEPGESKPSS